MDGDIGPTSSAINLSFDLCIATDSAGFFHPNLKFGLPSSPPLAYYLVQLVGFQKASELIYTRPELSARKVLELGIIHQVVSKEELRNSCIEKLRPLTATYLNGVMLMSTVYGCACLARKRFIPLISVWSNPSQ